MNSVRSNVVHLMNDRKGKNIMCKYNDISYIIEVNL